MKSQIRGQVIKLTGPHFAHRTLKWAARAIYILPGAPAGISTNTLHAHSWPEAMQKAYKLRNDLESDLMVEADASAAGRTA